MERVMGSVRECRERVGRVRERVKESVGESVGIE